MDGRCENTKANAFQIIQIFQFFVTSYLCIIDELFLTAVVFLLGVKQITNFLFLQYIFSKSRNCRSGVELN